MASDWVGLSDEDVIGWRERIDCSPYQVPIGEAEKAMCEEIAELRAKLREKNAGKPAAADTRKQDRWDDVPQDFRDWWNGDYDDSTNPFRLNSSAYWAWAGWKAAEDKAGGDEPVASIYITPSGEREFDDWKVNLPVGRNVLYTRPQPQVVPDGYALVPVEQWQKRHPEHDGGKWQNTDEGDAKWWQTNIKDWEARVVSHQHRGEKI